MSTLARTPAVSPFPAGSVAAPRAHSRLEQYGLATVVAGYVLLALWFSLVIPPFETPDELYHYAFVRHLAQGNALPVQSATATGPWQQEGSQAPLYYWLAGRLTAGINQDDFDALARTNPRANIGDPLYPGNKNRMLYSALDRPLSGSNLALHVARWLSVVLGALTVWAVGRTAILALGPRRGLLPPLLLALIPQFIFISASCSNDNLVIALASVTVFYLARLLVVSEQRAIRLWEWAGLGGLLGLAALSKLQGLGLFIPAAAVGLVIMVRRRQWWLPAQAILPVAVPPLLIAGWWYWRNYSLYGDWTGLEHLVSINGLRTEPLDWEGWWLEFRGLRYSFWGLFGWFNILLPQWVYHVLDGLSVAALAGLFAAPRLGDRPAPPARWVRGLLALWALLTFALVLYWVQRAMGSQGRLFFPAIGATLTLLVAGLAVWLDRLPRAWQRGAWTALVLLLAGATLYAGTVLIPASYAAPPPLAQPPATATPLYIAYGDPAAPHFVLRAVDAPAGRYPAGQDVPVTLYLTTAVRQTQDSELFVQLLDAEGEVWGNVTTHPGWGRNPTSLWQPGALYADRYLVRVNRRIDPRSPVLAQLYVGFIDPDPANTGLAPLPAYNAEGVRLLPSAGEVVLVPWTQPQPTDYGLVPFDATFAAQVRLLAQAYAATAQAGDVLPITLFWETLSPPGRDLAAFVHLLDAAGHQVAGYDQAPGGARFPTRAWAAGDRVVGELRLVLPADLPPGDYTLWTGLYPAGDPAAPRLAAHAPLHLVAHDKVQLGPLRIVP